MPIHAPRPIRSPLSPLAVVVLAGCASSGEPDPPPVPVWFSADEVPCAYEVVGSVREEVYPERDMDRLRRRVLGRAGVRSGADAVLSEVPETFTVERVDFDGQRDAGPRRITLEGDLLRYTDATCGGGGG